MPTALLTASLPKRRSVVPIVHKLALFQSYAALATLDVIASLISQSRAHDASS
jgi:hypothetical protein